MRADARETIERLDDNDTWLFSHMITAFWHGFGISNGLSIKKEDIEKGRYRDGKTWYRVKKEVMQEQLAEYIRWLEQYQESWGTGHYDCPEYEHKDIYEPHHKSREAITRMIELLQV